MDPQLVLYRPQSFEAVLGTVRAQDRFATVLMGAFALLALVLSLVGTYGVLSGTVEGRTREIGIRMALGADNGSLRRMVLGYAAALTLPGVALGLLGAWVASRWIEALLFGVEAVDPVAYGLAVLVFLAVGLFSGWLPAVRATRVDTVQTLASD
jgi:putative ABC transport system permease protein